jgi:hypothetical protein
VPCPRLAFTVNAGQSRGTINAVWLSLLPGPAGGGGADGPRGCGLMPGYVNVLAGSPALDGHDDAAAEVQLGTDELSVTEQTVTHNGQGRPKLLNLRGG